MKCCMDPELQKPYSWLVRPLLFASLIALNSVTAALATACSSAAPQTQEDAEEKEREGVEKVSEVLKACRLKAGSWVADLGPGRGLLHRPPRTPVGPKGRVFAVDLSEECLVRLRERVKAERLPER